MKIIRKILLLLICLNMAFIFWNSAATAEHSENASMAVTEAIIPMVIPEFSDKTGTEQQDMLASAEQLLREWAHGVEFFALGLLCMAFAQTTLKQRTSLLRTAVGVLLFCCAYALSDEIHQLFVNGRTFQLLDLIVDAAGAVAGVLPVALAAYFRKRRLAKPLT